MRTSIYALGCLTASVLFTAYGCGGGTDGENVRGGEGGAEAGAAGDTSGPVTGGSTAVGSGGVGEAGSAAAGAGATPDPVAGAGGEPGAGTAGAAGAGEGGAQSAGAGGTSQGGTTTNAGASDGAGAGGVEAQAGAGGALAEDPRCSEVLPNATVTAHLKITADNECDVFVNDVLVGKTTNWGSAVTIDVSLFVHPGRKNVVAVEGRNTSSQGGNDRGIIGELTTTVASVTTPLLVTNQAWRVSQTPGDEWTALDYDDSAWPFATEVASVGDGPWGNVLSSVNAKWIWFAPVPASTADKPNLESTFARRVFYFDFEGQPAEGPRCSTPIDDDLGS